MALKVVKEMSVRSTVTSQFELAAAEQKIRLPQLTDDLKLVDSGLNSLSIAVVVMRMEEAVGFDPFEEAGEAKVPVTFGDFVKLYESRSD
jgi:hypothetical protein